MKIAALALVASLALTGCTSLTTGLPPSQAAEATRIVIDADAAFIAAATALNAAEQTNPAIAATGEPLRAKAYQALLALRAVEAAGKTPSADSFYAVITQINALGVK